MNAKNFKAQCFFRMWNVHQVSEVGSDLFHSCLSPLFPGYFESLQNRCENVINGLVKLQTKKRLLSNRKPFGSGYQHRVFPAVFSHQGAFYLVCDRGRRVFLELVNLVTVIAKWGCAQFRRWLLKLQDAQWS